MMIDNLKLFTDAFSNSLVGMVILDQELNIEYGNSSFKKMINLQGEDKLNNLNDYVYPEDIEEFNDKFNDLINDRSNGFMMEIRYLSKDSNVKWWNIKITVTAEFDNKNMVIFAIMDDITLQKEQTNKLRDEKNIAERTTKIKSDFLANMSHEIRTPIHTIIGMNELLSETNLDPEQLEYVEQIRFSSDVLISLINDILDFSKIESGNLVLENIDFELYKLIEEAVNLVVLQAHKKGLEVCVDINNDVPNYVIGDPVRVRQIITNLFNNAVKFTKKGHILISVELLKKDNDKCIIRISVKDTGIGIPKDKMNKIFKAFSQVDSSTTRMYGGTGLGLSISKSLVNLMNGEISVESSEGEGSEFWFTAALGNNESANNNMYEKYKSKKISLNILLVDDNDPARNILKKQLENYGCKISEATDGFEALRILEKNNYRHLCFDACLIDLLMPGMDGWQLASEINNNEKYRTTKLFLLSPLGKSADEAKMKLLSWFNGYISKPVKHSDIDNFINEMIDADFYSEELEELHTYEQTYMNKTIINNEKILVAEDHEINQKLFKIILENMGYQVILVDNGLDVVEKSSEKIDLIFMDINMPGLNGYEATKKIREKGMTIPIIAVTANALKGEKDKCLQNGMDDFLTKPFRKKDIEIIFNKWLQSKVNEEEADDMKKKYESLNINHIDLFDFDKAVENFMGNKDVVVELLTVFMNKTESQFKIMENAIKENDMESFRKEAHSMKGGALSLEIRKIGETARLLEENSESGSKDQITQLFNKVRNDYNNFKMIALEIIDNNKK